MFPFGLAWSKVCFFEHSENIRAAALGVAVEACERLQPDSPMSAIAMFHQQRVVSGLPTNQTS